MEPIKRDMELLSNSMATYAHIQANPESFALYFMMGVCFGLLMALCLLVTGIACRPRRPAKAPTSPERRRLKESSEEDGDEDDDEDDDEDSMADDRTRELVEVDGGCEMLKVTVAPASEHGSSRSNGTLRSVNVFASAEELEKARRLEERERIVREIWRNGQPDILATGTGTIGRVHYH
ncbi:eva-1 homolog Bb [Gadus chalcogrammus]|uniref:eva-1 homolog Bb n=1 Tax=Gadus chalcogrammus TaxID=1042646 RepID=UPI0024C487AC|nr:eva-1 homolog Bb [Gadus chalcogrammus]XP_056438766.1 eva-1 homolog Bb [Gadus chalcogrammus]